MNSSLNNRRVMQPNEGNFIHNSRKIGPYALLEIGTFFLLVKITAFSLKRTNNPETRTKFTFVRITKPRCNVPLKNFFF